MDCCHKLSIFIMNNEFDSFKKYLIIGLVLVIILVIAIKIFVELYSFS